METNMPSNGMPSNGMPLNEFTNSFLKFEEKYEMFTVKINNIHIWHYLRSTVYTDLLIKEGYISCAEKNIQKRKSENTLNYLWKRYILCNQFFAHKRDVLIISHGRKYKDGDKYYKCPYTYLLDKYISNSHYILDGKTPDGIYELQRSHNILYSDIEEFKRIKKVQFPRESVSKREADAKIIEPIETYFKTNIELDAKKKWLNIINIFIIIEANNIIQ